MKTSFSSVPEHLGGTNLDEKYMPDRFQAVPEGKAGLKHNMFLHVPFKPTSDHIEGNNPDEKDIADRFQALPGAKTPQRQPKMNGL